MALTVYNDGVHRCRWSDTEGEFAHGAVADRGRDSSSTHSPSPP